MKTGIIIQARMSSQRLPGKVLQKVSGKPLLGYLLERLERVKEADGLVLVTSAEESDNPVALFCKEKGTACFRGSLFNVACRFNSSLSLYGFDAFVRISGDSPLIDPLLVSHAIELFKSGKHDLVTNVEERSFPAGQSVEVVGTTAFRRAFAQMIETEDLEHVTRFFYRRPESFKIHNFKAPGDFSSVRLTVDSAEDLQVLTKMVGMMGKTHLAYGYLDLIDLYYRAVPNRRAG